MADLSSYDPIYASITGSDTTGDGTELSPFASYQHAYNSARYGAVSLFWSGLLSPFICPLYYVGELLDGSIGIVYQESGGLRLEVTLIPTFYTTNPSRIYDASGTLIFYTDLSGTWFATTAYDPLEQMPIDFNVTFNKFRNSTTGKFVLDLSDLDINTNIKIYDDMELTEDGSNLPKIALRGNAKLNINADGLSEIWDYVENITFRSSTNGKNIYLTSNNSNCVNYISSIAGSTEMDSTRNGGNIILSDMIIDTSVSSKGADLPSNMYATGGNSGFITISNCTINDIISEGGNGSADFGPPGNVGTITITNSICGDIQSVTGDWYYGPGIGGEITITDSTINNSIESSPLPGNVTLIGSTNIPNNMIGNIITSSLNKGRGINGSNILGVV